MDHNVNLAECMVRQSQWGQTLITNVCSGATQTLPWQMGDWANAYALAGAMGFIGAMALVLVLFVAAMAVSVIRGY